MSEWIVNGMSKCCQHSKNVVFANLPIMFELVLYIYAYIYFNILLFKVPFFGLRLIFQRHVGCLSLSFDQWNVSDAARIDWVFSWPPSNEKWVIRYVPIWSYVWKKKKWNPYSTHIDFICWFRSNDVVFVWWLWHTSSTHPTFITWTQLPMIENTMLIIMLCAAKYFVRIW